MKKLVFLIFLAVLAYGCAKNPSSAECVSRNAECCRGSSCANADILCTQGMTPKFDGCNQQNCVPKMSCINLSSQV